MRNLLASLSVLAILSVPALAQADGGYQQGGVWDKVVSLADNAPEDEVFPDHGVNLLAGGWSHHFKDRSGPRDYNETNNVLGLEYEHHIGGGFHIGGAATYIRNSLDNDSAMIVAQAKHKWAITPDFHVGIGLAAGIQNGYPSDDKGRSEGDFLLVAYPTVEAQYKFIGAYGTCVPAAYSDSGFCLVGFKAKLFPW
ncbi:MAG: hypothetical protein Alpg2KO_25760 [Alphaproteobacteria bacterium]